VVIQPQLTHDAADDNLQTLLLMVQASCAWKYLPVLSTRQQHCALVVGLLRTPSLLPVPSVLLLSKQLKVSLGDLVTAEGCGNVPLLVSLKQFGTDGAG
jgi:hypothetical protein